MNSGNHVTLSLRAAGNVRRWHTWPMLREQTNAHHSWNVARILLTYFPSYATSGALVYWALMHDVGEVASGDVPHPAKRHGALGMHVRAAEEEAREDLGIALPGLHDDEFLVARLCDLMEAVEFARDEIRMGNQNCVQLKADLSRRITEISSGDHPEIHNAVGLWVEHCDRFDAAATNLQASGLVHVGEGGPGGWGG